MHFRAIGSIKTDYTGTLNQDNQGEIIIYNMQKRKLLPYIRILNMPYDVFGAWITPGAFVGIEV